MTVIEKQMLEKQNQILKNQIVIMEVLVREFISPNCERKVIETEKLLREWTF